MTRPANKLPIWSIAQDMAPTECKRCPGRSVFQRTRRNPATGGIVGTSLVHSDHIDEATAPTEQQLPEIGERRRLIEQLTQPWNIDGLLAVG